MLGSLAKWLRILGFDTFYSNTAHDNQLLEIIWRENRILLSKDMRLVEGVRPDQRLRIHSKYLPQQLKQVVEYFQLDGNIDLFSRCSECNVMVELIPKMLVADKVPEYVFDKYEQFWVCPTCRRIFWPGTHRELAVKWLAKHAIAYIE